MQETASLIKDFLSKNVFAVAGSFRDESKYAYQIFRRLKNKGKKVYPVNQQCESIDNEKCYKSVKDIKDKIDVVNLVTPPSISLKIVKECKEAGINFIWAQPGAADENLIKYCKVNNIKLLHDVCVLIETAG